MPFTKPADDVLDAAKLYDLVLSVIALSDIYSASACQTTAAWLRDGLEEFDRDPEVKAIATTISTFLDRRA
jgi:hypothetical protein